MVLQFPYPADRFTLVGTVTRSHGLKGEFKVSPFSGPPEAFEKYSRAALVAADGRMTDVLDISRCRIQGKQIILKLDTIDSKNEADLIVSMGVLVSREDYPAENDDSINQQSSQPYKLIGSAVFTTDGNCVGKLIDVSHTGAHPLLVVLDGTEEYLVPLVEEIVVESGDGRIVIDPPAGLLEVNRVEQSPNKR